jgi:ArsR family transcriptional regulator, virulence genes transcriptional regulator
MTITKNIYTRFMNEELRLNEQKLKKAVFLTKTLNHKLRQQILKVIYDKNVSKVNEIYKHLQIEQSVASQHLAILRKAGLVTCKRAGKTILYSVDQQRAKEVIGLIDELAK